MIDMYHTRNEALASHLQKEHKQSPVAEYLREIVYGGIDGIVTTFAVVAGFSGASLMGGEVLGLTFVTVLLFGFANLFADGISMGLGNFLSILTEKDIYRAHKNKERREIKEHPEMEEEETLVILQEKGFSLQDAQQLVNIYKKNDDYWVDWMMNHELEMPNPEGVNPVLTGLSTFSSFLVFGAIPLIPYLLAAESTAANAFMASIGGTVAALLLLGFLKGKVIGGGMIRSLLEVVLIGSVAAGIAFLVGMFFRI